MDVFTKLFGVFLVFVYHCFDRIVIHGYESRCACRVVIGLCQRVRGIVRGVSANGRVDLVEEARTGRIRGNPRSYTGAYLKPVLAKKGVKRSAAE